MLTWSPSCASLVAIRAVFCEKKRFALKFTDRRTDDGHRAIALVHSCKELITSGVATGAHLQKFEEFGVRVRAVLELFKNS